MGGTISPSGTSSVNKGGRKTFTITPKTGYRIADVIVDGESMGAVSNYTFSNVAANHTIAATFTVGSYVITATVIGTGGTISSSVIGTGGTISPSGTSSVSYEESKTFTITPNTGYRIAGVIVDGKSWVGAVSNYTFSNVTTNHTILAIFVINLK